MSHFVCIGLWLNLGPGISFFHDTLFMMVFFHNSLGLIVSSDFFNVLLFYPTSVHLICNVSKVITMNRESD